MPQKMNTNNTVTQFYAGLAPFYQLVYGDWEASIKRQAEQLDAIMRKTWGTSIRNVLDVSCGIGTQCLGLAVLGYQITASDLSPEEIDRARREAAKRDLSMDFTVADMRQAHAHHNRQFDLVLSCDNSVPHLLTDTEILKAFRQFFACTLPGGGCLISVRDYEQEDITGQKAKLYGIREEAGKSYLVFQRWDCHDDLYDVSMYFIEDDGGVGCKTHVMRSTYYAVHISRLLELMAEAGFVDVRRLNNQFFQPVILGTRKA
jgi:SAM-dependent methyltransferase